MPNPCPVLVAGAPLEWTRPLAALAESAAPLLAADGGADHLAGLGLRPQWVIGDLDSISPGTRRWLGEGPLVHRPDQECTDLDKALTFAFDELGLERLTVLAALGGRVDHTVVNIGLLARRALGERLQLRRRSAVLLAVSGEASLAAEAGETWSFWTFDPLVRVTLEGVRWPVRDASLHASGRPSLSNVAEGGSVRVAAEGGAVIVQRFLAEAGESRR